MRTVKQVSDLTGISVRMLHHYDKIGLLKPTKLTEAGYRLYDDKALETLQQILFFKELDLSLVEIKEIITNPQFDKIKALENHKKLIILKRDRLNDLIGLINKTLKEGSSAMSFKEFDMSEYYNVLEEFKKENKGKVIRHFGSIDKFDEMIEKGKAAEEKIAKMAIKEYGSIKKYAEAVKKNLNNSVTMTKAEQIDEFKKDCFYERNAELKVLYKKITSDLSKDPSSKEIQEIVSEIVDETQKHHEILKIEVGENYWRYQAEQYLSDSTIKNVMDKKYGEGAAKFIGEAIKQNKCCI